MDNGRRYIGQSTDIDSRWSKHKGALKKHCHDNRHLQDDWDEYGPDVFDFYVIEYCDDNRLDEREIYYIKLCKTTNIRYGYNMQFGGKEHGRPTEETKRKISESNKIAYQNSDLKKVRSKAAVNQWADPEIKAKIMGENNGMYGKKHTEEAKRKISLATRGRKGFNAKIKVMCVELEKAFESAASAARELGLHPSNILNACRGKRQTCGGYHWEFLSGNNI